ncbi:NifX-associated nitrogen fixation protein [Rhodovulum strictum]|uniref:NifX-associated nitrogen fixation protein n=1 Tax=Rhodovulum strictum TaxID=58314 RepID=A0A844BJP8_9RHOB|nr:NifX-associated nitrogen fixation protein [Rhodovulum strictum]MRH21805.1 NifX-associated nitrogen fixation protein [Rhodovulum strictum]
MSADPDTLPRGGAMPTSEFLTQLIAVIRAEDSHGSWDAKPDAELLADYIVTREERREIPIIGDPDPDLLWRVERFYDAIALLLERRTGAQSAQMSKIHHEGFGRIVLISGRLVVLSKHVRDLHRFGFESFAALAEAGDAMTADAAATLARFPDAARA